MGWVQVGRHRWQLCVEAWGWGAYPPGSARAHLERAVDEDVLVKRLHHAHALLPELVHQRGDVEGLRQLAAPESARRSGSPSARRQPAQRTLMQCVPCFCMYSCM